MDDPVLSDLHYTEDSNGTTVYYTILEDGNEDNNDESNILNTDSELLGDNVFYLSFENDSNQQIGEQQDEETTFGDSVFEEIMLPDGTHAYLKNELGIDPNEEGEENTIKQEPTLMLEDLVTLDNEQINDNSGDEDNPTEEQEIQTDIQQLGQFITTDGNIIEQSDQYEQVRLTDGSIAIMDIELYKSLCVQNKKKPNPPKDVNKAYDCPHENCKKAYTTMHHLRVHMRNHTGNRPYRCEVAGCEKAFSTGYSLKAHSRTHTGEKPYGCQHCFKSFKTSGDLQKHIRIHTGEKPFVCPMEGCGRSFTTSNIRKVHVRSHTGERPYECTVEGCDRAFASATNFKNHMRIHSGEKPYACTVEGCGKRFTEYSSLYKHHLVHTNFKPCKCTYCGRIFRQATTLTAHKRSVHNIYITENGTEIMLNITSNDNTIVVQNAEEQNQTEILFVAQ